MRTLIGMKKVTSFLVLNTVLFALVIVINTLANALPINGLNTGQLSDRYPSLFTPAGFTFSVWGVLYLLQLSFVIVQFWIKQESYFKSLSQWFWVSCLANVTWILMWHYLFTLGSVLVMLLLLYSLARIFVLLHAERMKSWQEEVFVKLTFTFYLSWICVATIANIATLLIDLKWEGGFLSPAYWTLLMILIAAGVGLFISFKFKEPFFLLILMWAFFGIYSKWNGTEHELIATVSKIAIVLLGTIFTKLLLDRLKMPKRSMK